MEVKLTPDQKAFVRDAIESGRLQREEEAVQEALALWEERERTRAWILAAVDEADASLARGEGRTITQQSMMDLAAEAKQRGRARLAAERETRGWRQRSPGERTARQRLLSSFENSAAALTADVHRTPNPVLAPVNLEFFAFVPRHLENNFICSIAIEV